MYCIDAQNIFSEMKKKSHYKSYISKFKVKWLGSWIAFIEAYTLELT